MKKGQILGMPFVYILALIVGALILIFGVKWIFQLQETASSVQLNKFVDDLRVETEKYYSLDPGSKKQIKLNLPNKVKQLCFKGTELDQNTLLPQEKNLIQLESRNNVFFIPLDSYKNTKFYINEIINPDISNKDKILCIKNPGQFYLETEKDFVNIKLS
nr:hypothetical protein [Candidatus Woesearchaeota archaeon]